MIEIIPGRDKINGVIKAPPSKGHTLRAFFIAALAKGRTVLGDPLLAEDQMYALKALKKFGVHSEIKKDKVIIIGTGGKLKLPKSAIFIGNSGVSARFLASFAPLAPSGKIIIDGDARMRTSRPIQDLIGALSQLGIKIKSISGNGCLPIAIEGGGLAGGKAKLKGEISSQYFSSILISAPYGKKDTVIECLGAMSSRPYIDITQAMMRDFGVEMENAGYKKFFVKARQKYKARKYQIEGDWTNASYFFAMAAVGGGKISVKNLKLNSSQGDKIFIDLLTKMGCRIKSQARVIEVAGAVNLKPIKINMNSYPDLVPTLAVVAAFAKGKSHIHHIAHLRFKECDRIKAVVTELKKIGVKVQEKKDGLIIDGHPAKLHGARIECYKDHRMAMAFAAAGTRIPGVIIKQPAVVAKSFPGFWDALRQLGIIIS